MKVAQSCPTLCDPMDCSLGQNTGMGSLSILPGMFQTQESNPGLLQCRWILYQLSHKGSPDKGKDDDKNKPRGAGWMGKKTQLIHLLTLRAKLKRLELEDWNTGKNARLVIYTWELLLK